MFKIKKNQTEFTAEQEALIEQLYQEGIESTKSAYKKWDHENVLKEMEWFMIEILQEKFEVVFAQSPLQAQDMAIRETGKKEYHPPLNYPWISDRRFVNYYKFGLHFDGLYGGEEKAVELLKRYERFLDSGIYEIVPTEKKLIVVKPFTVWNTDEDGRLHSLTEPAIAFDDGYEEYAICGVFFDKDRWQKIVDKKLSKEDIFAIQNTDERMAILSVYGPEWLLKKCNAQKVDEAKLTGTSKDKPYYYATQKSDYYELYLIPQSENIFSRDRYFLKYQCPSTGRIYVECVDNEAAQKGALAAIAWRFEASVEDFLGIDIHA